MATPVEEEDIKKAGSEALAFIKKAKAAAGKRKGKPPDKPIKSKES